ncbi:MAG TPA: cytidine deaminase [Actinomycetes bacterium]|nr:cytidine deaminase [Actinomycetes bacterium]
MPATSDPEDLKLVTLARSARARNGAPEGAAVRDEMGRTYAASTVDLPSLRLTAVQAAVGAALSSGSDRLEAVAVVGETEALDDADTAVLADVAVTTVLLARPDGTLRG